MSIINHNDVIECEVCHDKRPIYIPLITCAHSNTFCEGCIKRWFAERHFTCPKCREIWPVRNYLEKTNQRHLHIINASLTINYHRPSTAQNIHCPPSSTANSIVHNTLMCFSIGLLLGLIIYPVIIQS